MAKARKAGCGKKEGLGIKGVRNIARLAGKDVKRGMERQRGTRNANRGKGVRRAGRTGCQIKKKY